MNAQPDWYKSFFSGLAVEMWLNAMPAEATANEVAFLRARLQVAPPAKLLDVPCGGGRHSILLAEAGYPMTSVDLSADFLKAARARSAGLPIDWQQREMIDLPWTNAFDGVFCFGNSFGYLPDADNERFLCAVFKALKPGARFVLDYPMVAENFFSVFQPQSSHTMGDIHWQRNGRYDPASGRMTVEHTGALGNVVEKKVMSQRVYTYRQLCEMLAAAGFTAMQGYGGLTEELFVLGSQGLLMVATKAPG